MPDSELHAAMYRELCGIEIILHRVDKGYAVAAKMLLNHVSPELCSQEG
jgi:hypothetical protein